MSEASKQGLSKTGRHGVLGTPFFCQRAAAGKRTRLQDTAGSAYAGRGGVSNRGFGDNAKGSGE